MSKKMYSSELKLEIVKRYLENKESVTRLAQEYHIGSRESMKVFL